MSFHRFEDNATKSFNPHLSTSQNHLVDGDYVYFNLNSKPAGTGSKPHYHPNELLVFCVRGRINSLVGKERSIITPGTFVVVPPNARHSFKATEEEDCAYLYIKDHTWTLVGAAEDEALPEMALSVEEVRKIHDSNKWPGQRETTGQSTAIVEGLSRCMYKIIDHLEEPIGQCEREITMHGSRIDFGFHEHVKPFNQKVSASENEQFFYMLMGAMNATVNGETRNVGPGDIIHIKKGGTYMLEGSGDTLKNWDGVRYTVVRSTAHLEQLVDKQGKDTSARTEA